MVLFNDMDGYKKPTRTGKILKWAFRILLVFILLALFFIGSLNLLQGTGEAQRGGLASAISDLTGTKISIDILQEFQLFPSLVIDAQNITSEDIGTGSVRAVMGDFHFEGPGSIIFTKSNIFNDIRILNTRFINNGFTVANIERADVKDISEIQSHIEINGSYGTDNVQIIMPLESWISKRDEKKYYKFKDGFPFILKSNNTDIQGALVTNENNELIIFARGTLAGINAKCILAKPETVWFGLNLNDFYLLQDNSEIITGQTQIRPDGGIFILGDESLDSNSLPYDFDAIDETCKS